MKKEDNPYSQSPTRGRKEPRSERRVKAEGRGISVSLLHWVEAE